MAAFSELAFERASSGTMSLFRRRANEQHERDVLRHDVILFGAEPLTNAHSFGACLNTMFLFQKRNYAPLTQAFTGGATAA